MKVIFLNTQLKPQKLAWNWSKNISLIPCLHEVLEVLQNRTSGAITIYTDDLMATENFSAPQLSPPQDRDPEAL